MQESLLASRLDYFAKRDVYPFDLGLSRVRAVFNLMDISLSQVKVITVAGTNGKGSTVAMLTKALSALNYKVGSFTSPHVFQVNERINISGKLISDADLLEAFDYLESKEKEASVSLSYFELLTLTALLFFIQNNVDVMVLEVGLGGRLDSVNIVDADLAIITSIAKDHEAYLGSNLSDIALEKVAVSRSGRPCIYNDKTYYLTAKKYFIDHGVNVKVKGCDYWQKGQQVFFKTKKRMDCYDLPVVDSLLTMKHQIDNLIGVYAALYYGGFLLSHQNKLVNASFDSFKLPVGRLAKVSIDPDIIVDVAHNVASIFSVIHSIDRKKYHQIHVVFGFLKDKSMKEMAELIDSFADYTYVTTLASSRGANSALIMPFLSRSKSNCYETIADALQMAKKNAKSSDLILCFGSFEVAKEVLSM